MHRPFFSIIIPTHNRANDLERAMRSLFLQNFKNFEIVVADNNSKDNTQDLVKNFRSKKIVYFKNKENIGMIANLKKGVEIAKGRYVVLHGDDDFIIYQDTLKQVYNLLKKRGFGFVRLNYLYFSFNKNRMFDNKKIFEDKVITPKQKSEDIVDFLIKSESNFISGVVYKNYKNAYKEVFNSELGPWFRILYKNVYKYGGYLFSKHYFISAWSRGSGSFYILRNGKFKFEGYYNEISKVVDKVYCKAFLKDELKPMIMIMPAVKLTTSLKNFFNYAKRIIYLSPGYKYSFIFWACFFLGLFLPKFILRLIRAYFENGYNGYKIPEYNKILKNLQFLNQQRRAYDTTISSPLKTPGVNQFRFLNRKINNTNIAIPNEVKKII